MGVQVGDGNTQIIYKYSERTWTDGAASAPLTSFSGKVDSPYRGLSAFEERDAAFFFGRDAAIGQVLERMSGCLAGAGLLVVSGVSGAGKSSLLRAGVLPRVRGTGLAGASGAASWPCLLFTPGRAPLDVLAVQAGNLAGLDAGALRTGLDTDPARFALTARQAVLGQLGGSTGPAAQQRLLLVVDQFEQVFTQCPDEEQRRAFITALHAAATGDGPGQPRAALVVLGVRADFETRCADYPELAEAVQDRYLVTAMTERQLRMAIAEPARMAGSSVDDALIDVLLHEVSTRQPAPSPAYLGRGQVSGAGVLPLLSHALDQAWRSRAGGRLTLADYERTGGIEGAVAESAQRAYDGLTPAQQAAARQVFTRLTITSNAGVDTAYRADRAELTEGRTPEQVQDIESVLDAFTAERLITMAADTVEISHEVLLTAWPLMRDTWLADTHADRIVRDRLRNAAAEWARDAQDSSYLYSGSLLEVAAATAGRIAADPVRYPPLTQAERDFLGASERMHHRRARRRQGTIAFLSALAIALAVVAFVAVRARQGADHARDDALAGQLIAESQEAGTSDPVLARLESVAAWRLDPGSQARYAVLAAARLPGIAALTRGGPSVNAVTYSPDGKILAAGDGDGTVRLWDVATRRQIGRPLGQLGHARAVYTVAYSPDGKIVAAAGLDGAVRFWDVATHQEIGAPLRGDTPEIFSVRFSPDGKILATGGSGGTVQLWNVATHQQIGSPLAAGSADIRGLAFSPDGRTLATGGYSGTTSGVVRLWNVRSGRQIGSPFATLASAADALAFSPDGQTLGVGWADSFLDLYDVATRRLAHFMIASGGPITSMSFSPDSKVLATSDSDGAAQLWDVSTGQQDGASLTSDTRPVESVAFSPDGQTVATGSTDGTTRLWSVPAITGDPVRWVNVGGRPADSVAFSPDGKLVATGSFDGTARLWKRATLDQVGGPLTADDQSVYSVAFSPGGKILATGSADGTARLWNVVTHRQIGVFRTASAVRTVAFSANGRTLATGSADGMARLWDVADHQQIGAVRTSGAVDTVAFSPDGKILATGGFDGTVQLWSLATHRQAAALSDGQTFSVFTVAFSPGGTMLATGSSDQTARLWDMTTHQQIGAPLNADSNWVSSVAFSPDGQVLATGDDDGTVRLWDVATQQQIGGPITDGSDASVESVAFSPDGQTLAAGTYTGVLQLWDVSYLTHAVPDLCASVARFATPAELAQAAPGQTHERICP
jgi:uncharacterized delta-60 repeat protein